VRNLEPYPEPERSRFWKRLRRLTRLRRRKQQPAPWLTGQAPAQKPTEPPRTS
jgi:hypothetical protein